MIKKKRHIRRHFLKTFLYIAAFMVSTTSSAQTFEEKLPFSIGEKIKYNIRWEQIKAGKATVSVMPFTRVNDVKAYHFKLDVKTNKYVDILYKVRDSLEGFTDASFSQSLLYKKNSRGRDKRDVVVKFDLEKHKALYSNFGGKRDPIDIPSMTMDPVSAFFKMRTLDLKSNKMVNFPVTDGKKCFMQKGEVIRQEKITTPAGTFDTFLVKPAVKHFSGVFKKSKDPDIKVWITTDEKQLPIRIKVKVLVGNIIFDLASTS